MKKYMFTKPCVQTFVFALAMFEAVGRAAEPNVEFESPASIPEDRYSLVKIWDMERERLVVAIWDSKEDSLIKPWRKKEAAGDRISDFEIDRVNKLIRFSVNGVRYALRDPLSEVRSSSRSERVKVRIVEHEPAKSSDRAQKSSTLKAIEAISRAEGGRLDPKQTNLRAEVEK